MNRISLLCGECSSPWDSCSKNEDSVDFWWCRDCSMGVCKSCNLLRGHTEHRTNQWKPEEVFRSCAQALEGRCSRRAKNMHETKLAVKQFIAKIEVFLLNELSRALECANEPDRMLISRLNRAILTRDIYHLPSPTRPAWKTWNLDVDHPTRMADMLETVRDLLQLPRVQPFEEEVTIELKDRSEWNVRQAAEAVASCLGAHIPHSSSSRASSPDGRHGSWVDELPNGTHASRRRTASSDGTSHSGSIPLEPNVFVRERPSVMSFRERSVPAEETVSPSSPVHSGGSVMSSLPVYPHDDTLDTTFSSSTVTPVPRAQVAGTSAVSSVPSSDDVPTTFGSSFLTRPISVVPLTVKSFPNALAVSDSCGGVYVCTRKGDVLHHILIKNSSASSLAVDEVNEVLYVSVMQAKGRSVHVFDLTDKLKRLDVIPCPKEPKIEMSRTRWLTVGPRGQLFLTSGDNNRSALWVYVKGKKGWKTLKESRKTRYQYLSVAEDQAEYKAVVLLTCDAANNRLLLFVVDHSLSLINEYDLSKTYRLHEHISSPASAIVDPSGNLLVLDYATGKVWALLSGVKGVRRLKEVQFEETIQPQEALGIAACGDYLLVACFSSTEVRVVRYLESGVFRSNNRSPSLAPVVRFEEPEEKEEAARK